MVWNKSTGKSREMLLFGSAYNTMIIPHPLTASKPAQLQVSLARTVPADGDADLDKQAKEDT